MEHWNYRQLQHVSTRAVLKTNQTFLVPYFSTHAHLYLNSWLNSTLVGVGYCLLAAETAESSPEQVRAELRYRGERTAARTTGEQRGLMLLRQTAWKQSVYYSY